MESVRNSGLVLCDRDGWEGFQDQEMSCGGNDGDGDVQEGFLDQEMSCGGNDGDGDYDDKENENLENLQLGEPWKA